jgi:hypothetical protein
VGACAFYLCLAAIAPAADKGKDALPVKFFVDVTSTRLVDEVKTTDKRRLDLGGVPVMLGALRQDGGALPSVAAGISGSHDVKLANGLNMKANGYLARVHTQGLDLLQDARAGGELAFQYAQGGTSLALKPSARAAFRDDVLGHVDYALNANAKRKIVQGFDLSLSAGNSWRVSEALETDNRQNGYGRVGLRVNLRDLADLPDDVRGHLEFGYDLDRGDGPLAWQRRVGHGPSLSGFLEPAKGWRFSGRYRFSDTARGYDGNDLDARRHERRHRLNFEGDWALESLTGADWRMKACYVYELTDNDVPVLVPESHLATVQFALNF